MADVIAATEGPAVGRKRGKKPVNLVTASGYRNPQDIAWIAIRQLQQFTLADVMVWMVKNDHQKINQETVKSYLTRLEKGGYITVIKVERVRQNATRHTYQLSRDSGVHAPRVTRDGKPSTQGLGRESMWRSMKILKSFSCDDLCQISSVDSVCVSRMEAKDYIKHLYKAGYLQLVVPACKHPVAPARYSLKANMNTGYHPPMIQRIKRVFDLNLNKVMSIEEEVDC